MDKNIYNKMFIDVIDTDLRVKKETKRIFKENVNFMRLSRFNREQLYILYKEFYRIATELRLEIVQCGSVRFDNRELYQHYLQAVMEFETYCELLINQYNIDVVMEDIL